MSKFGDAMRGLTVFISDIRNCKGEGGREGLCGHLFIISKGKSKEAERKRINKELANIRSKFKSTFVICFPGLTTSPYLPPCFLGDKNDGYQKKKYVCKLLFIFLLGNDINFGYQEAVNLLSSIRFSEKQIVSYDHQKKQDSLLSLSLP